jgi:hypothetical protein
MLLGAKSSTGTQKPMYYRKGLVKRVSDVVTFTAESVCKTEWGALYYWYIF